MMIILFVGLLTACTANDIKNEDLSAWQEDDVYSFLEEVEQHIRQLPVETDSIEQVIAQYEIYFASQLSKDIVYSNFIETENGWKIPDGDAGYIFFVPSRGTDSSEVTIDFTNDYIKIQEVYEFGMFKEIEYTIELVDGKPKITEWKRVFD